MEPLPSEPTAEMRAAYNVLQTDDRYPVPTGQAALWAVVAGYAADPVAWVTQLLILSETLIEEET
jgi:hypothetical protein